MKLNLKLSSLALVIALSGVLISCGSSETKKSDKEGKDKEQVEEAPTEYKITCNSQIIYTGPGEEYGGLVDEVVSEIQGFETYSAVWDDYNVIILDSEGDWSEIEIIDGPKKLVGWIPTACIDK